MQTDNRKIYCIHAQDETTIFLNDFQKLNFTEYYIIEPGDDSITNVLAAMRSFEPDSKLVFLGHGHSTGLYSPAVAGYDRRTYINSTVGNNLFKGHDILLLSCRSADFLRQLNTYSSIIGFGNIPSSLEEVEHQAKISGQIRNILEEDIDHFNKSYVDAITGSIRLLIENKIVFEMLPNYIAYHVNRQINVVLRKRDKSNRVDLARLLFEFRNEMTYRRNFR